MWCRGVHSELKSTSMLGSARHHSDLNSWSIVILHIPRQKFQLDRRLALQNDWATNPARARRGGNGDLNSDVSWTPCEAWSHLAWSEIYLTLIVATATWTLTEFDGTPLDWSICPDVQLSMTNSLWQHLQIQHWNVKHNNLIITLTSISWFCLITLSQS